MSELGTPRCGAKTSRGLRNCGSSSGPDILFWIPRSENRATVVGRKQGCADRSRVVVNPVACSVIESTDVVRAVEDVLAQAEAIKR
jgi:hypothetical protein